MSNPANSSSGQNMSLSTDRLLALYRTMLTIRRSEEQLARMFAAGKIIGAAIPTSARRQWQLACAHTSGMMTSCSAPIAAMVTRLRRGFPRAS